MNFEDLKLLNDYVLKNTDKISKKTFEDINRDFELTFTHDSTKIEGNTLTIFEVKTILEDGISIGGKKLREIYEVINNQKAFNFIKNSIKNNEDLTEDKIKDIHEIVVENIFFGGIYRNINVRISGASFIPPEFTKVREEIKNFIFDYKVLKKKLNPIELAGFVHAEFVRIHPFSDGNGRCARLLMNYILMENNFKPITINPNDRIEYYNALDFYGKNRDLKNLNLFINLIMKNEMKILLEYKKEIEFTLNINI